VDEDFDDGYGDPSDYGMSQSDFDTATSIGQAVYSGNDDNIAQAIANSTAQPQVGQNRSNVTNMSNYDPRYAAALDISRGLDPTNNFGGTGGLAVPSYLRPQTPGNLVLNEAGDRMMYGSPVERFAQETLPPMIRDMQKVGIGGLLDSLMGTFTDAKNALGFKGDAEDGLKAEDFTGMMSTRDDQLMSNMSQQGAGINVTDPVVNTANVNMGSIPQVSPTFDAFGNVTRDAGMSRFSDQFGQINAGISNLLPEQSREANVTVNDALRSVQGPPAFIDKNVKRIPGGFDISGQFDYPGTTRDPKLESIISGTGAGRPTEQDAMNTFLNRMYTTAQNPIKKTSEADVTPFSILRGVGSQFQPEINQFLKQNVSPNLNFESDFRRDPNDPNKMMPYLGLNYGFNIG